MEIRQEPVFRISELSKIIHHKQVLIIIQINICKRHCQSTTQRIRQSELGSNIGKRSITIVVIKEVGPSFVYDLWIYWIRVPFLDPISDIDVQ